MRSFSCFEVTVYIIGYSFKCIHAYVSYAIPGGGGSQVQNKTKYYNGIVFIYFAQIRLPFTGSCPLWIVPLSDQYFSGCNVQCSVLLIYKQTLYPKVNH